MLQKQIVVVEDEPDILEILIYNLKRDGFIVSASNNGAEGLRLIQQKMPDLVLLDLMLPGMDGLDICRHLKDDAKTQHIPVIMVSAKGEESDVVLGLGLGADDYISKPFSPRELIARVRAVLRRSTTITKLENEPKNLITVENLVIDSSKHKVTLAGEPLILTATEFRILHYMACHTGRVFSRDQLLSQALREDTIVVDRNIDVHIRAIRKKMGGHYHFIETVRGVGYRFKDID